MTAHFFVRAEVADPAERGEFDRWCQHEHPPQAAEVFQAVEFIDKAETVRSGSAVLAYRPVRRRSLQLDADRGYSRSQSSTVPSKS